MSTKKLQLPVSGFPYGLNTEASPINFLPSELMTGTTNVELMQNASVRRRRGVDFFGVSDAGGYLQTLRSAASSAETKAECPRAQYVQLTAPNGAAVERTILHTNNTVKVYLGTPAGLRNFDTPYQTLTMTGQYSDQKFYDMQFTASGNRVYFTGKYSQPGYLSVDTDNVSLKLTYFDILIRDPTATSMTSRIKYTIAGVIRWFDCIEAHTSSTGTIEPGVSSGWERYWVELYGPIPTYIAAWVNATPYTTKIVKIYNKLTTPTSTTFYPTISEFYAGRLWLSGDPTYPNRLYFSQVIQRAGDESRMFQFADPFDVNDPNIVDSDGGLLELQGAGEVRKIIAVQDSLFTGTTTAVFQIAGPDGSFKATDFSKSLVLEEPVLGTNSMCKVGQEFIIYGQNNIYMSKTEFSVLSAASRPKFLNLSEEKINSLYRDISKNSKMSSRVLYSPVEKRVYYFYCNAPDVYNVNYNVNNQPCYFTNILVLDVRFLTDPDGGVTALPKSEEQAISRRLRAAFFTFTFTDNGHLEKPFITAPFTLPDPNRQDKVISNTANVVSNGSKVVTNVNAINYFVVGFLALQRSLSGSTVTLKAAFSRLIGTYLQDWYSDSTYTVSYTSKAVFGFSTMGDILHKKMGTYLFLAFNKVETGTLVGGVDTNPGGAYLRTAYNWSTSTSSPKYGDQVQVYYPYKFAYTTSTTASDGTSVIFYKKRVRGRGQAMNLILENEGDKDFHLLGWNQQFFGHVD